MVLPEKAIICTPTKESARQLRDFVSQFGYFLDEDDWYEDDYCYDLGDKGTKRCCGIPRSDYLDWISRHDSDPDDEEAWFVPDDLNLRFISLDDFIAYCSEGDSGLHNISLDLGGLL